MTRKQEDKIIKQAQDILARRVAVQMDIKVDLRNIAYYGAYYQGAMVVAERLIPYVIENYRSDEKVYIKAELDLITASKRNMQLYLDGTEIRLRNHKRNNKGKLEWCEAYFMEYRQTITEVK